MCNKESAGQSAVPINNEPLKMHEKWLKPAPQSHLEKYMCILLLTTTKNRLMSHCHKVEQSTASKASFFYTTVS